MDINKLGKVLFIIAIILLLTGWYFNQYIWIFILNFVPFSNEILPNYYQEIYLAFNISMIFVYILFGFLGIKIQK